MKLHVLILAAASSCGFLFAANGAPAAYAQAKPMAPPVAGGKKPHRPGMVEMMTVALGLSPAQQTQLKAIMKTHGDKKKSIDNALLTADGRKAQLKTLDEGTRTQMLAILTPAQKATFLQGEAARKAARANAARKR